MNVARMSYSSSGSVSGSAARRAAEASASASSSAASRADARRAARTARGSLRARERVIIGCYMCVIVLVNEVTRVRWVFSSDQVNGLIYP